MISLRSATAFFSRFTAAASLTSWSVGKCAVVRYARGAEFHRFHSQRLEEVQGLFQRLVAEQQSQHLQFHRSLRHSVVDRSVFKSPESGCGKTTVVRAPSQSRSVCCSNLTAARARNRGYQPTRFVTDEVNHSSRSTATLGRKQTLTSDQHCAAFSAFEYGPPSTTGLFHCQYEPRQGSVQHFC